MPSQCRHGPATDGLCLHAAREWRNLHGWNPEILVEGTMKRQLQIELEHAFRRMHDRKRVLLLANCWDAGSARLFVRRGFAAIATTSAGVAWSLG